MAVRINSTMPFLAPSAHEALFVKGGGVKASGPEVNTRLRKFARIHGIDAMPRSHQFRRFFAVFYMRRFQGPLDGLRRHFRHVDRRMIHNYVGSALCARYFAREAMGVGADLMNAIVHEETALAPAERPERISTNAKYRAHNVPLVTAERVLARHLQNDGTTVVAMEWGYCLLNESAQEHARCKASDGTPNDLRSCPEVCGGCRHLFTGAENVDLWKHVLLVHREIVRSPHSVPKAKAASGRMVEVAADIIGRAQEPQRIRRGVP